MYLNNINNLTDLLVGLDLLVGMSMYALWEFLHSANMGIGVELKSIYLRNFSTLWPTNLSSDL
jgi:hypothetical protein